MKIKKLLFYTLALSGTMVLFLSFGFLPTDCSPANAHSKNCVVAGIARTPSKVKDCTFNGFKLFGKVKFVTSFPDIKIQFVKSFPDLKVKFVESFADKCGEWEIVESFPDIKVQVVESFPDIKVKVVESFPGVAD